MKLQSINDPVYISNGDPMSDRNFDELANDLEGESFEKNQLSLLEISSKHNLYTVEQAIEVNGIFTYSKGKLKAFKLVYPNIVDKGNACQILDAFISSSDKKKEKEFIENYKSHTYRFNTGEPT